MSQIASLRIPAMRGFLWIHIVYDDRWRMVALFNAGDPVTEPKELLIPHNAGADGRGGSSYIDSYAVSEFDGSGATAQLAAASDGVLQTRRYYIQNWRADVIGMVGTDAIFQRWYKYSAYGQHQWISAGDIDDGNGNGFRDGSVDLSDLLAYLNWFENGDGGIDSSDQNIFNAAFSAGAGPESRIMYAGYAHDPLDDVATSGGQYGLYHVRHRVYSPELGRWTRRDPIGYSVGKNLREYVNGNTINRVDPSGLMAGPARVWLKCRSQNMPSIPACPSLSFDKDIFTAMQEISNLCPKFKIFWKYGIGVTGTGNTEPIIPWKPAQIDDTCGANIKIYGPAGVTPYGESASICAEIKITVLHEIEHAKSACTSYSLCSMTDIVGRIQFLNAWNDTDSQICNELNAYWNTQPEFKRKPLWMIEQGLCSSACGSVTYIPATTCIARCKQIAWKCKGGMKWLD